VTPPVVLVLMGVAGSGKTTVGKILAARIGWPFFDGDEFHPAANVERMARGIPLTDADRRPWLDALAELIRGRLASGLPAVVACSALKRSYRRRLGAGIEGVSFVYLRGGARLIAQRLGERQGHFAGAGLLDSQLEALEEPGPDEALVVDIGAAPEALAGEIASALGLAGRAE
jgi:gluconokinase